VRERNWRCAEGEIDLIVTDGDHLVFVEVKTRSGHDAYPPVLALTRRKRERVRRLALRYIERTYGGAPPPLQPRFDVVLVVLGREPEVEHLVNAF
jgi:putative endonuclease